ncbi:MAG: hypothetical protein ACI8ZB_004057 [Desulforhopalus sp.]|jgi:hypothetical protein
MPSQVMGYYRAHKSKLLKDFDRTSALLKASLILPCLAFGTFAICQFRGNKIF